MQRSTPLDAPTEVAFGIGLLTTVEPLPVENGGTASLEATVRAFDTVRGGQTTSDTAEDVARDYD